MPKFTREELNAIMAQQIQREAEYRERVREAVAAAEPPLPDDLVKAVIQLFDSHTRSIMRGHKGAVLAERRSSYQTSLSIMELAYEDLLSAIETFAAEALREDTTLFSRLDPGALEVFERRIQKELFATANAAASLVDHARRVQKILELSNYDSQVAAAFGHDGLHDFVIALRVLLHHLHMVEAGWNKTNSFSDGKKTATFMVHKDAVQRRVDQYSDKFGGNKDALRAFVEAAPNNIDLKTTFEEYRARMRVFHAWLNDQLESESLIALRDYDRIMLEKKRLDTRTWWNMLIGNWLRNWKTLPNPHDHLQKYLTPVQLEEVYKLTRNSKEQVDLIIRFVDTDDAIDDGLRKQAYELFERSPPPI